MFKKGSKKWHFWTPFWHPFWRVCTHYKGVLGLKQLVCMQNGVQKVVKNDPKNTTFLTLFEVLWVVLAHIYPIICTDRVQGVVKKDPKNTTFWTLFGPLLEAFWTVIRTFPMRDSGLQGCTCSKHTQFCTQKHHQNTTFLVFWRGTPRNTVSCSCRISMYTSRATPKSTHFGSLLTLMRHCVTMFETLCEYYMSKYSWFHRENS